MEVVMCLKLNVVVVLEFMYMHVVVMMEEAREAGVKLVSDASVSALLSYVTLSNIALLLFDYFLYMLSRPRQQSS
jgi:hypothetical protein